jgi:PAS domain S-box-containing protein
MLRHWYATVTDIEDRKRAEETIREQEAELRRMLDLTPQCLAVLGADGSPIYANRASLDYLGMTQDEWKQSGAIDGKVHPDDEERLARASSISSAYEAELRVRNDEGGFRWFLSRFSPLLDEKGQITRWYIASTDIEGRKRAEERLEKENAALREEIVQASMFEEIVGTSPALLVKFPAAGRSCGYFAISQEAGKSPSVIARLACSRLARQNSCPSRGPWRYRCRFRMGLQNRDDDVISIS